MNKKTKLIVLSIVILALFLGVILFYHQTKNYNLKNKKIDIPPATSYQEIKKTQAKDSEIAPTAPVEGGLAESEHFKLESSPQTNQKQVDILKQKIKIPKEINLDVPWTSQAPEADWSFPYQEACEEASMIMVDGFYHKQKGVFDIQDAKQKILKLVEYQKQQKGDYLDTSAKETGQIIKNYFKYHDVRVMPFKSIEDIKNIVGRGFPVIVPFYGKALKNPNYHNGGPLYHMMVIKGYTKDGQIITNDPGTRRGHDYIYSPEIITSAAHDWNNGDVVNGQKFMIVIIP